MRLFEIDNTKRNKLLYFRQTIDSLLKKIEGKTIVAFDVETSGLSIKLPWVQVTEIAAVAIDADSGKQIDKFHHKVRLTPETKDEMKKQKRARKPESSPGARDGDAGTLDGPTGYPIDTMFKTSRYSEPNAPYGELRNVYEEWVKWLSKFDKPMMLGQNVAFDMGHMFGPLAKMGIPRPDVGEVMDTMVLGSTWIYPLLKAGAEAGDEKCIKMMKAFDVERGGKVRQSFNLPNLGKAFGVKADHWHSGISDVMQTYGIFNKMLKFFKHAEKKKYSDTETFKKWHGDMSDKAFKYGKQPAFGDTVKSQTKRGIKTRGKPRD